MQPVSVSWAEIKLELVLKPRLKAKTKMGLTGQMVRPYSLFKIQLASRKQQRRIFTSIKLASTSFSSILSAKGNCSAKKRRKEDRMSGKLTGSPGNRLRNSWARLHATFARTLSFSFPVARAIFWKYLVKRVWIRSSIFSPPPGSFGILRLYNKRQACSTTGKKCYNFYSLLQENWFKLEIFPLSIWFSSWDDILSGNCRGTADFGNKLLPL